jgi:hypothetical protein
MESHAPEGGIDKSLLGTNSPHPPASAISFLISLTHRALPDVLLQESAGIGCADFEPFIIPGIVQAVFALSASSSYLRLSGQDILASTEDCIPTKQLLYLPACSQLLSRITRAPIPDLPLQACPRPIPPVPH